MDSYWSLERNDERSQQVSLMGRSKDTGQVQGQR